MKKIILSNLVFLMLLSCGITSSLITVKRPAKVPVLLKYKNVSIYKPEIDYTLKQEEKVEEENNSISIGGFTLLSSGSSSKKEKESKPTFLKRDKTLPEEYTEKLIFDLEQKISENKNVNLISHENIKKKKESNDETLKNTYIVEALVTKLEGKITSKKRNPVVRNERKVFEYQINYDVNYDITLKFSDASSGKYLYSKKYNYSVSDKAISEVAFQKSIPIDKEVDKFNKEFLDEYKLLVAPYEVQIGVVFFKNDLYEDKLELALQFLRTKNTAKGLEILKEIAETKFSDKKVQGRAKANYANLLIYTGNPEEALPLVEEAMVMDPEEANTYTYYIKNAKKEIEINKKMKKQMEDLNN